MTLITRRLDVASRRAAVAKMVARGYDTTTISNKLSKMGFKTIHGKKITPSQVGKDLKEVEKIWLDRASVDISRHKARQYEELQKLKQVAWKKQDFDLVLKILEKEMVLLGTKTTASDKETPKYVKHETNQQFNILTLKERDERINKLLDTARTRKADVASGCGSSMEAATETAESL